MQLQGKTDARFVEAAFKIFRDKFGLHPVLTAAQFLEQVRLSFTLQPAILTSSPEQLPLSVSFAGLC